MLTWIYTGSYFSNSLVSTWAGRMIDQFKTIEDRFQKRTMALRNESEQHWAIPCRVHLALYNLGNNYGIEGLKQYSTAQLIREWRFEPSLCFVKPERQPNVDLALLARLVFNNTQVSTQGMRHFIVGEIMSALNHGSGKRSTALVACMREHPTLAVDVATLVLSEDRLVCFACRSEPQKAIRPECRHQVMDCDDEECLNKWEEGLYCAQCGSLGDMRRLQEEGSETVAETNDEKAAQE